MAKRMGAMGTIVLSAVLLFIAGVVLGLVLKPVRELFGAQGGELVQLATSHVPTAEDAKAWEEEQEQIRRDLIDMTGSP